MKTDSLVPLMAQRSLEMILGIFGILVAGAGYVPLDSKWPDDRVAEVIAQCSPAAVCAGPGYLGVFFFFFFFGFAGLDS